MNSNFPGKILTYFMASAFLPMIALAVPCESGLEATPTLTQARQVATTGRDLSLCLIAQRMDIQGHRGIAGFPNNTLASFHGGYAAGAEKVELDLQITKDNHILVAHDPTLSPERCVLRGGKALAKTVLREMTFSEAQDVVCAENKYAPGQRTEPLPELKDVFSEFKNQKTLSGQDAGLNIEIKYDPNHPEYFPPPQEYVDRILEVIRAGGWSTKRMIVQSFDHDVLLMLKKKAPDITIVPLVGNAKDSVAAARKTGGDIVTPSFTQLTPEIVNELHRMKVKAVAWTPDSEEEMRKAIATGADGIITNHPDVFIQLRDKLCRP